MSELCVTSKLYGKFKFIVTHADGSKTESNEFDNLILNNAFSNSNVSELSVCAVGSGTTAPSVTDTALVSQVGSLSGIGTGAAVTTTWEGTLATVGRKNTYSFTAGAIVGNISEVAIYSAIVSRIAVRTLVKDLNGNPTTITLTAGDQLSVEYTLFVKIETRPPAQTLNINGVDYSVKTIIGFPEAYASTISKIGPSNYPFVNSVSDGVSINDTINIPADGVAQRLNTALGNRINVTASLTTDRSVTGELTETFSATIPTSTQLPSNANIKAVFFTNSNNVCNIAVVFDPPLPKNNTVGYTFKLACKIARA
ncbi:hypothetical protein K5M76_09590 [Shewanella xiamenensis]|uniref:hypothetical protein n=1 Tax=Shewanella xiamenensis TaxID=332186 RepID=UPI00217DC88B|nr:hypothetical protein [Shewanella xiamenensis]MCT8857539.1 hypothetical protein [Shewanella xiamenensis]UWG66442.1 hypothetical protein K5M76_09590 [Shewanella xiamenensis]